MKNFLLLMSSFLLLNTISAQLKPSVSCPVFKVDILRGNVNGAGADFTIGQIKEKLPCATSEEAESKTAQCGGGIFYKDKDVYFYTQRDYIEIGPAYKGEFTIPVMHAKRGSLFSKLGNPVLKDAAWDAYQTQYGILVLYYSKENKVNRIIISTKSTQELDLCL